MDMEIEVSIGNIESLYSAIAGGATRIELCSALALGGITPSYGLMQQAGRISSIPVYAIIRPRQGDFFYSEDEIDIMMSDITCAKQAGLQGVVLGALTSTGHIHMQHARKLCDYAHQLKLGVTFHRAFDHCNNAEKGLEDIISLGCERVLTSGLASTARLGTNTLANLVQQAGDRISIMAGAGVNAGNAKDLAAKTRVKELHLSGKTTRPTKMMFTSEHSKMGANDIDDYQIPVTDKAAISEIVHLFKSK
ncbi:putative Cytoplasmic copper homeostasis protein cutC [Vibrio nigripulchritudo MADA3029]|uniref:copper homeostasis protein CutC n=1 Tax=Vibrio nigripulchritudo TaxID=28173 RepID=UPI0003B1BA52|nr:copper homeostasis protein CutC [Vibrio nigripulchritudo]CCN46167.1 putative Cytoplasmic copper homeostasis protein cutC [Vibrio nigripulchritudo MADA3020]CCN51119.1 putative Cytoplasmic copper homeostasis protein cutC [Vibrio nigripulchritudo MADA3021]CCN56908.1 putative Cytoplasmic copper homeostasis protein cutC [Vibrio nigripulchritudo MADA3029]